MSRLIPEISGFFGLSEGETKKLIASAPYRYKVFHIKKRNSEKLRTVAQPAREVKELQRWLVHWAFRSLPVHEAATAYIRGSGIRLNAQMHVNCRYLLKMDFQEYFPSIKLPAVRQHLTEHLCEKYRDKDILRMCKLVLWKRTPFSELELCIGGPSSPIISNSVAFEFDKAIATCCAENGVTYTRYADDLIFSTNRRGVLRGVEKIVEETCARVKYPILRINSDKTVHVSKKYRRRVTGVTLSAEGKCSMGRDTKRLIRATLHWALNNRLSNEEMAKLRGYLAFANDIEPSFVDAMQRKYGEDLIRRVFRWNSE